jgi:uncharacterized protein (DUF58 family)
MKVDFSKLKNLELRAKFIVEGTLIGKHRSPYHGFSHEFQEHRPYQFGEEIKYIDWKVYGRRERLYIKKFEQETNVKVYLLLDNSNSMNYSSGGITKFEYAATLIASIGWVSIHQGDSISLITFDEKITNFLPPAGTQLQFANMVKILENIQPKGKTNFETLKKNINPLIKKKNIIIIVSDLLGERDVIINGIKSIRYKGNEVIVFHILDPIELNFNFPTPFILKDLETKEELHISPTLVNTYRKNVTNFISNFKKNFTSHQIDYSLFLTTTDPVKSLVTYLLRRKFFLHFNFQT